MMEEKFDWDEEWNLSFAGCGFRSVYYLGALSCVLERAPRLVHGASKICGASSGCLVAAALAVGIPIEQFCVDVLNIAKEARTHTLGVFHPRFSLLRTVRASLQEKLPADAHLRASGRLCVSLTRMTDGQNVLVSEFDSREELIQVLVCSCFFPVYCGFFPPSYRGVLYMDGALSNNLPLFEQRNTITLAPFSGESDICPREGTFNCMEVHYGNVSIQVNTGNVHRVWTSFLPTRPQTLAEICHSGYMDALLFLTERDLLGTQRPLPETETVRSACCDLLESQKKLLNGQNPRQEDHWWLDPRVIENLPVGFKKVLCEACRDTPDEGSTRVLPVRMVMCLLSLLLLPVEIIFLLTKSVISSVCRLLTWTEDLCRQTWSSEPNNCVFPKEDYSRRSSDSDFTAETGDRKILTSTTNTNSDKTLHWDSNGNLDNLFSLNSSYEGPSNFPTANTTACGNLTLNHRIKRTL